MNPDWLATSTVYTNHKNAMCAHVCKHQTLHVNDNNIMSRLMAKGSSTCTLTSTKMQTCNFVLVSYYNYCGSI